MRRARLSGMRTIQIASALAASAPVFAQEEEPSLDFLEYLGSWEDEDEAWYVEVQIEERDEDEPQADDSAPKELRAEREND